MNTSPGFQAGWRHDKNIETLRAMTEGLIACCAPDLAVTKIDV